MEQIMEMLKAVQEKADANRKAYREDIKSDQAKMIAAFKEKMDAMIANIKNDREETTACHDEMEARIKKTEPNSGGGDRTEPVRDS
jgi:hypothetical protein